jgi:hypothetical protein
MADIVRTIQLLMLAAAIRWIFSTLIRRVLQTISAALIPASLISGADFTWSHPVAVEVMRLSGAKRAVSGLDEAPANCRRWRDTEWQAPLE